VLRFRSHIPHLLLGCLATASLLAEESASDKSRATIPVVWDTEALRSLQLPLADASISVAHMSAEQYYNLPVRVLYETYPIYHPDHEPPGYFASLQGREPKVREFTVAGFKGDRDWIEYGKAVFQAPTGTDSEVFSALITVAQTHDRAWYDKAQARWDKTTDIMPYARYVIRAKGKVEVGALSCAMCHTRVMDDGTIILGAQGNFPFDRANAVGMRAAAPQIGDDEQALREFRAFDVLLFGIPWRRADPLSTLGTITLEKYIAAAEAVPGGVLARHGTSPLLPVQIPDLIGVADRAYLDRTGLVRHRSIADLMRYAALNQGADYMTRFGDFVPGGEGMRDVPASQRERYSDEQLYALARYVYSLQPPQNPNMPRTESERAVVERGKNVFDRLGCGRCHRPPLYTNNKLTPVDGFAIPRSHLSRYDIYEFSLGTDPGLSLETRRGTGYYKVPSLKGVWYRGPLEHNGSVATLEDWFDPKRLSDHYVPTGWKGPPGTTQRAVRGHLFGLNLPPEDRAALIAFLRTL
jgi:hypothetical protein